MPYRSPSVILGLVDKLYAAALNPAAWGTFLSATAEAVDADHAFVCQLDHQQKSLSYIGLQLTNRSKIPTRRYGTLLEEDPRRAIFDAHPNSTSHCRMGLSDEDLRNSKTYRNYLRPLNIEYTMVTCVPVREGYSHDLGFTRRRDRTAFRSDDCALLNELVPHLRRAFEISRALEDRSAQTRSNEPDFDDIKLQTYFALTGAQTRLAIQLVAGRSVKDAALALDITEGTARQYLKKIFEKTGARRQLDLVRSIEQVLQRDR